MHTYLVEGEPLTLIDTGPYTPDALRALRAGLADLGYAPSDLERIVITHAHTDHFGLTGVLAEASGAQVWAHALARPAIEDWADYNAQREPFWYDVLLASGVPAAQAEQSARLYQGMRRLQTHTHVDRLLDEGDSFEMAGQAWQALYCPGHSPTLICFYQPESRLLIGNDHLLAHISSNAIVEPPLAGESERRKPLIDYWRSLCRVFELDTALVLPGHGEAVADHRSLISQRFTFYEQRLARLRSELANEPRTVWQLAGALFRKLDAVDTFLAASEIIGHLDVLADKGQVVVHSDSHGVWKYELQTALPARVLPLE